MNHAPIDSGRKAFTAGAGLERVVHISQSNQSFPRLASRVVRIPPVVALLKRERGKPLPGRPVRIPVVRYPYRSDMAVGPQDIDILAMARIWIVVCISIAMNIVPSVA